MAAWLAHHHPCFSSPASAAYLSSSPSPPSSLLPPLSSFLGGISTFPCKLSSQCTRRWASPCPRRFRPQAIVEEAQQLEITESPPEVSSNDNLTMFFQAEGTLKESAVPKVVDALKEIEGVSDVHVSINEGLATAELRKQTSIEATSVASGLVEIIQREGFKLQHLNISFDDVDDDDVEISDYDISSHEEDETGI